MRLYLYGNSGGIGKVIEDINNNPVTYNSIVEVFNAIIDDWTNLVGKQVIDYNGLSLFYYGYDSRLCRNVYIIMNNSCEFMNFMIDLDEVVDLSKSYDDSGLLLRDLYCDHKYWSRFTFKIRFILLKIKSLLKDLLYFSFKN